MDEVGHDIMTYRSWRIYLILSSSAVICQLSLTGTLPSVSPKHFVTPPPIKSSNPHPPVINNERSHIFFSCFFLVARWLCKQSLLHTSTSPSTTNSSSSSSTLALVQKIHLLCVCWTNSPSLTKCYLGK